MVVLGSGWADAGMPTLTVIARTCSGYSFKMFFDMSKAPTRLTIGAHVLWYWPHCLQQKASSTG